MNGNYYMRWLPGRARAGFLALFAIHVFFIAGVAAAASGGNVILVLDASGSMWGQVDGRPKIEIAREVVGSIIADWDESVHLGLTVYGHRRKGDCTDIESMIGVGPVNKPAFINTVNRINPKGKTPLSQAVVQAARELRYTEEKASVILVSDGKETCHMDPCAVGRELEAAGVDFTAHIIGFDVSDKFAIGQLRCLADNTGGSFTLASNAKALKEALQRAVAWTRVSLRAPEYIFSNTRFEVEWEGPNASGDKILFVPRGSPEGAMGVFASTMDGSPARLIAPSGTGDYEVRYHYGPDSKTILKLDVTLRGSTATVNAPVELVTGTVFDVEWTGPNHPGDRIVLVKASEEEGRYFHGSFSAAASRGSPSRLTAFSDPGDYEVRYLAGRGARVLARQPVTLIAARATLEAPAEVEAGVDFKVRWTGPGSRGDRILIVKKGTQDGRYMTGGFSVTADKGNPVTLMAYTEPGDYEVRYQARADGKVIARVPLRITATTLSIDAPDTVMAGNSFDVQWKGSSRKRDRILVMPKDAPDRRYMRGPFSAHPSEGRSVRLIAYSTPGEYEVRYLSEADGKVIARESLRITPSDIRLDAPVEVHASQRFEVGRHGGGNAKGRIVLVKSTTPEGSYFTGSGYNVNITERPSVELRAFAEQGEYEIRFMAEGDGKTLAVSPLRILESPAE